MEKVQAEYIQQIEIYSMWGLKHIVWKLRPELYDALTEFDILRFLPESGGAIKRPPKFNLSPKETVDYIKNYRAIKKKLM